jgi:hypothetical protein
MPLKSVIRKLALPLIAVTLLSGCTDAFRRNYISEHVLGMSGSELDLARRAKALPFEDLKFEFQSSPKQFEISLHSERWNILGYGIGSNGDTILISEVAGIPDPSGSTETITEQRFPGRKFKVVWVDEEGEWKEIYRER